MNMTTKLATLSIAAFMLGTSLTSAGGLVIELAPQETNRLHPDPAPAAAGYDEPREQPEAGSGGWFPDRHEGDVLSHAPALNFPAGQKPDVGFSPGNMPIHFPTDQFQTDQKPGVGDPTNQIPIVGFPTDQRPGAFPANQQAGGVHDIALDCEIAGAVDMLLTNNTGGTLPAGTKVRWRAGPDGGVVQLNTDMRIGGASKLNDALPNGAAVARVCEASVL